FCQDRIGIDVGQNSESFLHQNFRRREGLDRIWQQIMWIGMNLELDPGWQSGVGGEPRYSHRVIRIARAAGVRQQEKFFRIDEIENVCEWIVLAGKIGTAQ